MRHRISQIQPIVRGVVGTGLLLWHDGLAGAAMIGGRAGFDAMLPGDAYDRVAALLSSTSVLGLPLWACGYTLLFAGFTAYVTGIGRADTSQSASAPSVTQARWRGWGFGVGFGVGFAGVLHFAAGTFGG